MTHQTDKYNILSNFQHIKPSYENVIHKKIFNSDYLVAIPCGKKCFVWFTMVDDVPKCLVIEFNRNQIKETQIVTACFSPSLSYGTILYGTLFYYKNNTFFSIEDIFSYKGYDLERICWGDKMRKINSMLNNDLKQVSYNKSFVVFGLPVMSKTNEELEQQIQKLGYKIVSIQYKLFNKINYYLSINYETYSKQQVNTNSFYKQPSSKPTTQQPSSKPTISTIIKKQNTPKQHTFLVKPDIAQDIYYLYCLDNEKKEHNFGVAHIPDYNSSVMMNKLFRNIKENTNLDALEESDDEEEFENINVDKFVRLNECYKMTCEFNYKFKRWTPIKLADTNSTIVSLSEVSNSHTHYTNTNIKHFNTKYKVFT